MVHTLVRRPIAAMIVRGNPVTCMIHDCGHPYNPVDLACSFLLSPALLCFEVGVANDKQDTNEYEADDTDYYYARDSKLQLGLGLQGYSLI